MPLSFRQLNQVLLVQVEADKTREEALNSENAPHIEGLLNCLIRNFDKLDQSVSLAILAWDHTTV